MIRNSTKKKLIVELEKTGNIFVACARAGIGRSTYYKWIKEHSEFRIKTEEALEIGRESNCDVAEHCLMFKVRQKDVGAIKYLLSHTSPRFKMKETPQDVRNRIIEEEKERQLEILHSLDKKTVIRHIREILNDLDGKTEDPIQATIRYNQEHGSAP